MSRLTWRDPAGDVAYQRQLRDSRLAEGVPAGVDLGPGAVGRAIVKPVSRALAQQIILRYEWLGTMAMTSYHYGIFYGMHCAGVTCFGVGNGGANLYANMVIGVERNELAYLARGACVHWAPPGSNSRLVSVSSRLLRQETGIKATVAYADTDAGEIGTIYQACGWTYIGLGAVKLQWIHPVTGRVYDSKLPGALGATHGGQWKRWAQALRDKGYRQQEANAKHRYIGILDKADRGLAARVARLALPYPKRSGALVAAHAG